ALAPRFARWWRRRARARSRGVLMWFASASVSPPATAARPLPKSLALPCQRRGFADPPHGRSSQFREPFLRPRIVAHGLPELRVLHALLVDSFLALFCAAHVVAAEPGERLQHGGRVVAPERL